MNYQMFKLVLEKADEPEIKLPKKPFDESERGEWKSWLKAQHAEN